MADTGMNGFMEFWQNPDKTDEVLEKLEKTRQQLFENNE